MSADRTPPDVDLAALQVALRRDVDGEIRFDPGSRHLFATDASNYRHVPFGVVLPRSTDALVATVRTCVDHGVPVTLRGGGTSLAGQATNRAVVVDTSRHLTRILAVDRERRTATVEPGVVLSDLQAAVAPLGLRFGPDPSTSNRCTVGGMVANNSCGPHSVTSGRTVDQTVALRVATSDGEVLDAGLAPLEDVRRHATAAGRLARLHGELLAIRDAARPLLEERMPALPRLVSGIRLEELCRPGAMHLGRALVGTEGTCAVVLAATVALVDRPAAAALAVLGYPDDVTAAAAVPALLDAGPAAVEGLDDTLVGGARQVAGVRRVPAVERLPAGRAWLVVEMTGESGEVARRRAEEVAADAGVPATVVTDPRLQAAVWEVRAAGLGSITYATPGVTLQPGWEDAAVPVDRLADYLRGLHDLLDRHGLTAGVYGHYGDGCVHTKIGFDHTTDAGRVAFRAFVEQAADLTVSLGGSLSGEHGDGQARGELLERMYGRELVELFRRFRTAWDPSGLLNPGRLVDAEPLDVGLRAADRRERDEPVTALAFRREGGVVAAFDRCVGAGTCRRDDGAAAMCPSYRATHEEQHSTRGRARLLGELLRPDSELTGWDDAALVESLELCLSCKACVAECPVGVDLASYKAEVAHQRHDGLGVPRPWSSRLLGRIRALTRLGSLAPGVVNTVGRSPAGRAAWRAVGLAPERSLPPFAATTFRAAWRRRGGTRVPDGRPTVLLVDTFTDAFAPQIGAAAVQALEGTGHAVEAVTDVCCGRPRHAEGLLTEARRDLDGLVDRLAVTGDAPVVWLEPSCLSVMRGELPDLRDDGPARDVARRSMTLAELAVAEAWPLPRLDVDVVWHPHCHHRAAVGADADTVVLDRLGRRWQDLDAGCCGLAGAFGFVDGDRYDVSIAVAEDRFAPRLAAVPDDTVTLMDGFSCRQQASHLGLPVRPRHLAELLAAAVVSGR